MLEKTFEKNKGITLIALTVTIVVLIILAGVSIATLSGNNGMISKAKQAKDDTENAEEDEKNTIQGLYDIMDEKPTKLRDENMFEFEPTTNTIVKVKEDYIISYYENDSKTYFNEAGTWCKLKNDVDTLIIPSTINGVAVKNIESLGVINAKNLIIEEGIETIGAIGGVYGDSELETVTLPESLVSMENAAFMNCTKLTTINVPGSLSNISYRAFFGCTSLANVTISDGVTSIKSSAFQDCKGLTDIRIPASVTSINDTSFYSCYGLTITLAKDSPLSTSKKWGAKKVQKES